MYDNFLIRKDSLKNDVDENGNVIVSSLQQEMQTTEECIFHYIMAITLK
jgi:hypothetical protein